MSTPSDSAESLQTSHVAPISWWQHGTAFCLIVVEMFWVLPWYRTLVRRSADLSLPRAALVLGGIMLVSYAAATLLESLLLLRNLQLGALACLLVVEMVLAQRMLLGASLGEALRGLSLIFTTVEFDPGPSLLVVFVLWLWWRGISLARQTIHPQNAWRRFELGMGLYMVHIFVVYRLERIAPALGWSMSFLFVGFLSVLFARISYLGLGRGGKGNPFNRRWLAGVSAIIAISVIAATTLGFLLTGQGSVLLDGLAQGVRLMVQAILFIAAIPALILAFVLSPLVQLLQRALPTSPPQLTPTVITPDPYWITPERPVTAETQPIPPFIQALIFWGIILALAVFLLLRLRQARPKIAPAALGQPESLLGPGEARRLLRKAIQDAFDDLAARLRPARKSLAAERVRQIYAALLVLCAERETPRPFERTPLEFLPVVQDLFPSVGQELDLITQAYIQVRYGEYPESPDQVGAVEAAWVRVVGQASERD